MDADVVASARRHRRRFPVRRSNPPQRCAILQILEIHAPRVGDGADALDGIYDQHGRQPVSLGYNGSCEISFRCVLRRLWNRARKPSCKPSDLIPVGDMCGRLGVVVLDERSLRRREVAHFVGIDARLGPHVVACQKFPHASHRRGDSLRLAFVRFVDFCNSSSHFCAFNVAHRPVQKLLEIPAPKAVYIVRRRFFAPRPPQLGTVFLDCRSIGNGRRRRAVFHSATHVLYTGAI
ncbi:hypothetical protein EDE12_1305 [Methylosinus sp. sav-2]|nr:hypothetical protein EDE12_1305 [Methylosinus sp. sav-2]